MNPTQQKTHTMKTQELEAVIRRVAGETGDALDDLERHLAALDKRLGAELQERIATTAADLNKRVGEERGHRIKLAEEQRSYVDRQDMDIVRLLHNFQQMPLGRRLRWLFTGKV